MDLVIARRLTIIMSCAYVHVVVNERLAAIEHAYKNKDFPTFGKLTMQDSNQFHATCLDTYPPIFYLNEVSRKIIGLVHVYNSHVGRVQAAYTFDAGPNAVIFLEEQHVQDVMALLLASFPSPSSVEIRSSVAVDRDAAVDPALLTAVQPKSAAGTQLLDPDSIKMYYVSRVGGGTQVLGLDEALVDVATGEPDLLPIKTKQGDAVCGCFWARQLQENAWLPYAVAAGAFLSVAVAAMTRRQ